MWFYSSCSSLFILRIIDIFTKPFCVIAHDFSGVIYIRNPLILKFIILQSSYLIYYYKIHISYVKLLYKILSSLQTFHKNPSNNFSFSYQHIKLLENKK